MSFQLGERSPASNAVSCSVSHWVFYRDCCCARVPVRLPTQSGWSWFRDRPGCVWGTLAHQPDPSPTLLNSQSCSRSCGKAVLQSVVGDKVLISPVFLGTPAGRAHRKRLWVIYACGVFVQPWEDPAHPALLSGSPETAPTLWASRELNSLLFGKKCLLLVLRSSVAKLWGLPVEVFVKQSKR